MIDWGESFWINFIGFFGWVRLGVEVSGANLVGKILFLGFLCFEMENRFVWKRGFFCELILFF